MHSPCLLSISPSLTLAPALTAPEATSSPMSRRSGNYKPSLWTNDLIQSLETDHIGEEHRRRLEDLKQAVRHLFDSSSTEPVALLDLVDNLQQLGVGYHFEKEISKALDCVSVGIEQVLLKEDLYSTALLFRLFRENGYEISQDIFKAFWDERDGFRVRCLLRGGGPEGLLRFYEASFLAFEGEGLLDEAKSFATHHLRQLRETTDPLLNEKVRHALELPLHWRLRRQHARWMIDVYAREAKPNPVLLELAKLDYNILQSIHRKEVKESSRWWTSIGLGEHMKFARNRIAENFLWSIGISSYEPQFDECREWITQAVCIIAVIDDVYDIYGTVDELQLFTCIVERWDSKEIGQLPEYMQILFLALFNNVNEFIYRILRDKKVDVTVHMRVLWTQLCKAYLQEAKWYHSRYIPTFTEYLENASISTAGPLLMAYVYFLVTHDIDNKTLYFLFQSPPLLRCSFEVIRLTDDLGTSRTELKRGDVPKAVECYMHQENVSEAYARDHVQDLINETWKKMNKYRFANPLLSKAVVEATLNFCRQCHSFYLNGDEYGFPGKETNNQINTLLIESIL